MNHGDDRVTTDTAARRAVPEGWPPLTPVELTRVGLRVTRTFSIGMSAVVLAIVVSAWVLHRDNLAMIALLSKVKP